MTGVFVLAEENGDAIRIDLDKGLQRLHMESVDLPFNTDCFLVWAVT